MQEANHKINYYLIDFHGSVTFRIWVLAWRSAISLRRQSLDLSGFEKQFSFIFKILFFGPRHGMADGCLVFLGCLRGQGRS